MSDKIIFIFPKNFEFLTFARTLENHLEVKYSKKVREPFEFQITNYTNPKKEMEFTLRPVDILIEQEDNEIINIIKDSYGSLCKFDCLIVDESDIYFNNFLYNMKRKLKCYQKLILFGSCGVTNYNKTTINIGDIFRIGVALKFDRGEINSSINGYTFSHREDRILCAINDLEEDIIVSSNHLYLDEEFGPIPAINEIIVSELQGKSESLIKSTITKLTTRLSSNTLVEMETYNFITFCQSLEKNYKDIIVYRVVSDICSNAYYYEFILKYWSFIKTKDKKKLLADFYTSPKNSALSKEDWISLMCKLEPETMAIIIKGKLELDPFLRHQLSRFIRKNLLSFDIKKLDFITDLLQNSPLLQLALEKKPIKL